MKPNYKILSAAACAAIAALPAAFAQFVPDTATQSEVADARARSAHLLPVIVDGEGAATTIIVANAAAEANSCVLDLFSDPARFDFPAAVTLNGNRAEFALEASGGQLHLTSNDGDSLILGAANLDCALPVVAETLLTNFADGLAIGMSAFSGAQAATEVQFPVLPRISPALLTIIANNGADEVQCGMEISSPDVDVASFMQLDLIESQSIHVEPRIFEELIDAEVGAVKLSCSGPVYAAGVAVRDNSFTELPATVLSTEPAPPTSSEAVLSVAAGPAVTEGAPAMFTINFPSSALVADLTVEVLIEQNGDFVEASELGPKNVYLNATDSEKVYMVPTVDDAESEAGGKVMLTIVPKLGYSVNMDAMSAEVTVNDND